MPTKERKDVEAQRLEDVGGTQTEASTPAAMTQEAMTAKVLDLESRVEKLDREMRPIRRARQVARRVVAVPRQVVKSRVSR